VFPTAGSYDVEELRSEITIDQPSRRRSIALKGYQHWQGRALLALEALRGCGEILSRYTLEIYLPVPSVVTAARDFAQTSGISLKIHEQSPNIEILRLFGRSRVGFSMSITDG